MAINYSKVIINGHLGAGKSSIAKRLAQKHGFNFLSTGMFVRAEAKRRNIQLSELQELMKKDLSIDESVDVLVKQYLVEHENYIIDSRMGAFFEPRAFKILLLVEEMVGAQRIFDDMQGNPDRKVEKVTTVGEVLQQNKLRLESEKERYFRLYQFDHLDPKHYDLVIDTTYHREEEVFNMICAAYTAAHTKAKLAAQDN